MSIIDDLLYVMKTHHLSQMKWLYLTLNEIYTFRECNDVNMYDEDTSLVTIEILLLIKSICPVKISTMTDVS